MTPRILPRFATTSEMFPLKMPRLWYHLTSFPCTGTFLIKDYVNNDDQFNRKMAVPHEKFFDLVKSVLTTTQYIVNFQFYQQTNGVPMGGLASSTTAEIYMKAHQCTAIYMALYPPNVWE